MGSYPCLLLTVLWVSALVSANREVAPQIYMDGTCLTCSGNVELTRDDRETIKVTCRVDNVSSIPEISFDDPAIQETCRLSTAISNEIGYTKLCEGVITFEGNPRFGVSCSADYGDQKYVAPIVFFVMPQKNPDESLTDVRDNQPTTPVVPLNVSLTVSPTQVERNTKVTLRCSFSHTPANLLFMMILDNAGVVVYHKDFIESTWTQAGYYYSDKVMNGRLSEDNQTLIVTVLMTGRPDVRGFRCEVYSNQPPYEGSHYQKVTVTDVKLTTIDGGRSPTLKPTIDQPGSKPDEMKPKTTDVSLQSKERGSSKGNKGTNPTILPLAVGLSVTGVVMVMAVVVFIAIWRRHLRTTERDMTHRPQTTDQDLEQQSPDVDGSDESLMEDVSADIPFD